MEKQSYGSAYLYAEDLLADGKYNKAEVVIESFIDAGTLTTAEGKKIDKPSLSFAGKSKMLVLCKVNQSLLKYATGEASPTKWIGKKITLVVRKVDAFGTKVPAIRVWPSVPIRKGLIKFIGEEIN